jgi:hypothetical protein
MEEERFCRFCFENESAEDNPLISPCHCTGTQKYVHKECLNSWQSTLLLSSAAASGNPTRTPERRHVTCSTCGEPFLGVSPPTRLSLVEAHCDPDLVQSLHTGSLLVTSQIKSERRLPERSNIPPLLAALFELKSSHWRYGVYLIFHFHKLDDGSGEEPVLAINLTRPQSGSRDEPIPDEVLQVIDEGEGVVLFDGNVAPDGVSISIRHHNGGPVHWSSIRTASCVINLPPETVIALYRSAAVDLSMNRSDVTDESPPPAPLSSSRPLYEVMNPSAEPNTQFKIWSLSPTASLVIGRFADVLPFVHRLSRTPLPHLNGSTPVACGMSFLVNSYSGYAQWSRAQLIQELSDPQGWGVVVPEESLRVCGRYLETAQPPQSTASEERDSAIAIAPPSVAAPIDRLSFFRLRGREMSEEKLGLWRAVRELCVLRRTLG